MLRVPRTILPLALLLSAHALSCSTSVTPIDAGSYAEQTIRSLLSIYERMDANRAYVSFFMDEGSGNAGLTLPAPRRDGRRGIIPPCYHPAAVLPSARYPGDAFFNYPGGRIQLLPSPPPPEDPIVFVERLDPFPIQPGDRVMFETTGGDFPAFRAEIVFPPPVRLIQPQPSASPIPLRRDQPLQLRWEPSWAMFVFVVLSNTDSAHSSTDIACVFVTARGSGTIPAEAVSMLAPGDAELLVSAMEMNIMTVGTEHLVVQARNYQSPRIRFRLE